VGLIGRGPVGMAAAAPNYDYVKTPRFVYYSNNILGDLYRIEVVELKSGASYDRYHVPFSYIKIEDVEQILIQTEPLPVEECVADYIRAERVVTALNNMDLALQAVSLEPDGIKNLFNRLWRSDQL
jgi:hypothetical protein